MLRQLSAALLVSGLLLGASSPARAVLVSTVFTYQGELALNGSPVTGTADFRFHLYDAPTNGTEVTTMIPKGGVQVSGGIFTVTLDFGATVFDGSPRWLEIEVRSPSGGGVFETLAPRQALTASPYSIQTRGLFVDAGGNVGIGTTAPAGNLHIAKSGGSPTIRVENLVDGIASLQLADPGQSYELRMLSSDELAVIDNTDGNAVRMLIEGGSGDVGIGTASPEQRLHVSSTASNVMLVESSATQATRLKIRNTSTDGREWDLVSTGSASGVGPGKFLLRDPTNGGTTMFQVTSDGHMGIGASVSPSATNVLKVGGTVECDAVQINGGSDLAEPFEVSGADIVPGTVVSIDPENPAALRPSSRAYDRTVAGVISGAGGVNPGVMLRQTGTAADGTHPVALTGRVYCRVDADAGGAIQPGDLLTTSDTPGFAMRVDDHARATGAIIGKAMTSLEHGRGLVLVLVSLQ